MQHRRTARPDLRLELRKCTGVAVGDPATRELFDIIDTSGDGIIDAAEADAFYYRHKHNWLIMNYTEIKTQTARNFYNEKGRKLSHKQ